MERYEIPTVERGEELSRAPIARVDCFRWTDNGYTPRTEARLVHVRRRGFLVRLTSWETARRAVCRVPDGEVYRDSCLEFFVNFAPERGEAYLNLEVNPLGTLHVKFGPGRVGRRPLPPELERPRVETDQQPAFWRAEIFIPLATIKSLFGKAEFVPGDVLRGNFYKCGDDAAFPHYGMWSPVLTESPDFHRPEYFGELALV